MSIIPLTNLEKSTQLLTVANTISATTSQESLVLHHASIQPPISKTHTLRRMVTSFDYTSPAYITAIAFTIGSVLWVTNGFFAWLPLAVPSTAFEGELTAGTGYTAFFGTLVFEIGGVFAMIDVLSNYVDPHGINEKKQRGCTSWVVCPTWTSFREHHAHTTTFWAALILLISTTVFWVAGLVSIPGTVDFTNVGLTNAVYWTPQLVGSVGFVISCTMITIDAQEKWWKPAVASLNWHVGFWNVVGSMGFMICAILGFYSAIPIYMYWASFSSLMGSCCFLIGSVCQWYYTVRQDKTREDVQILHGIEMIHAKTDSVKYEV